MIMKLETRQFIVFALLISLIPEHFSYEVHDINDAMQYLSRFGYVGKDTASSMNIVDASDVIKEFQRMSGVNQTGELDTETVTMMNVPRCGNKDMEHEMIPDADDVVQNGGNGVDRRRKRYKLNEYRAKWGKRELTYRMAEYSPKTKISPELVEKDVASAFRLWEEATNLNFVRSNDKNVDIELHFASMTHHDSFPFDGPGKTLAHAFPPGPGLGGDVHFDDSETWSVASKKGTNVLFVAVHEIGHSLGLSHSDAKGAIMQAFYGGYRPHLILHEDDVAGIQAIYGKRENIPRPRLAPESAPRAPPTPPQPKQGKQLFTHSRLIPLIGKWNYRLPLPEARRESMVATVNNVPPPVASAPTTATTTTMTTTTTESTTTTKLPETTAAVPTNHPSVSGFTRPDLCTDSRIDAISTLKDGFIYVFKGFYVFRIDETNGGILPGWPSRIEFKFNGLEGNIDAALTRPNGKTFFFKGGKYWRFTGFDMDPGYPKSVSKHFPGIPDYIDAAFENAESGQLYFTKGDKLWRFDPLAKSGQHVSDIYPLLITTWDIPESGIDDAFVSPTGGIYLFKDDNYWKFDTTSFKVAKTDPPYPRSSKKHWFGCSPADGNKSNIIRNLRQNNYYPNFYKYLLSGGPRK